MYRYELQSDDRYADYYFTAHGTVMAGIGDKRQPESISYPSFYWRIGFDGQLLISDEKNGDPHTVLALVSITSATAQIRNVTLDSLDDYTRWMTD